MSDKADEFAQQVLLETSVALGQFECDRLAPSIAHGIRSYAAEIGAERDRFREQSIELTADCYKADTERDTAMAERERLAKEVAGLRAATDNADGQLVAALECHAWGECLAYVHSARAALSRSTTEEDKT